MDEIKATCAHEETTIKAFAKAIASATRLLIHYEDVNGNGTVREVRPEKLKRSKAGDLLISAWDINKEAYRSFRSDRIVRIHAEE